MREISPYHPEHEGADKNRRDVLEKREYSELRAENFEEHEKWQKNLKEVVSAMRRKRDALKEVVSAMKQKRQGQPESEDIRLLIIVLGGGMQGPYGAGQMSALEAMGYLAKNMNDKDTLLGVSAGAATCAFGMSGKKQALLGTCYFYTICTGKEFINYMRLHKVVDVAVITEALRSGPMSLHVQAAKNSPIQFYVQAYNETKKEPEFINAKAPDVDMIEAIHASMALPVVYNKAITINGSKYTDGAFDDPLPIKRAIQKFCPTHILIFPNMPFNQIPVGEPSKVQNFFINAMPHAGTFGLMRKILNSRQSLRQTLEVTGKENNVKIGVAWPPEMGLGMLTKDSQKIKTAIKAAAKDIFDLFGEPEKVLKLYEEEYPEEVAWRQ